MSKKLGQSTYEDQIKILSQLDEEKTSRVVMNDDYDRLVVQLLRAFLSQILKTGKNNLFWFMTCAAKIVFFLCLKTCEKSIQGNFFDVN